MKQPITHASVFSGIGGPEVAAQMLGWENLFHCEINPFGRAVLDYWFPNAVSYEDITTTDFSSWRGRVDVLTGGFPCQPFSYAGKRRGAEDDRYLWPFMHRCINQIQPTWVVCENVAGILTMVEQGKVTEMASEATIFDEGDLLHGYEFKGTFTLQRVCDDLEADGYEVQPILIPACGVGAPHRRDRVFIVGHRIASDSDERTNGRNAGENEGESGEERDKVRVTDQSSEVRSTGAAILENTMHVGQLHGQPKEQGSERDIRNTGAGSCERICAETSRTDSSNANRNGYSASEKSGGVAGYRSKNDGQPRERCEQTERTNRLSEVLRNAPDSDLQRFEERQHPGVSGKEERQHRKKDCYRGDTERVEPGCRWRSFPTVSPVHRGNDGLPFSLDDLTIPQTRWRFESLKAYGNAIVPQVMYEIFLAIEKVENR